MLTFNNVTILLHKCVWKVGGLLNKHEISIEVFNKVGSVAKTTYFVAQGLENMRLFPCAFKAILI